MRIDLWLSFLYCSIWYWTREQRIIRTQEGKIFTNIIEDILHKIPRIRDCYIVKSPHHRNVAETIFFVVKNAFRLFVPLLWEKVLIDGDAV